MEVSGNTLSSSGNPFWPLIVWPNCSSALSRQKTECPESRVCKMLIPPKESKKFITQILLAELSKLCLPLDMAASLKWRLKEQYQVEEEVGFV